VCETIFDIMLRPCISGLEAYHKLQSNTNGRDQALKAAEVALATFRKAEGLREGGDVHSANASVEKGLLALKERYGFHPSVPSIISYSVSVQEQFRLCTDLSSS
jgi:hypothetical protein